jgi:hypothetical protein
MFLELNFFAIFVIFSISKKKHVVVPVVVVVVVMCVARLS